MVILQACVDDSRTNARRGDRIFMLGALLSTYDAWAKLSDEWQAKLDEPPGLAYFKLSQALALKDEFDQGKGWTPALRDERLCALAEIAKRHALCGISCYMPEVLYDQFVKPFAREKKELKDPYFLCFYQMVDAITSVRATLHPADGLDYIFDDHGDIGKRAVHWWDRIKTGVGWRDAEHLGSTPIHRDDKSFKPLQAADLYAGLRRHRVEAGSLDQMTPSARKALEAFTGLEAWDRTWTKDDAMEITAGLVLQNARRRGRRRRVGEG